MKNVKKIQEVEKKNAVVKAEVSKDLDLSIKAKVQKVEKTFVPRIIMRNTEGRRVHLMNINMKNKILKNVNWKVSKTFTKQDNHKLDVKSNKHFKRLVEELKEYELKSNELLKNVGEVLKCRQRYWIAKDKTNVNRFLVESDKNRVPLQYLSL